MISETERMKLLMNELEQRLGETTISLKEAQAKVAELQAAADEDADKIDLLEDRVKIAEGKYQTALRILDAAGVDERDLTFAANSIDPLKFMNFSRMPRA